MKSHQIITLMTITPALFAAMATDATATSSRHTSPSSNVPSSPPLVLNGEATRTVWGFSVYRVSLFLEKPSSNPTQIMNHDSGPKRVMLKMLRSVKKSDFMAAIQESIDRNLSSKEKAAHANALAIYNSCIERNGDIKDGSVITIDYIPSEGMVLAVNNQRLGVIPGRDFFHLMLRLWIGQPTQSSIKEGLLASR